MAQTNYTPISLYYSPTAAAVPTSGNLVAGELALNTNDGKLYYKNSSGVVTLLAGATSGPAGGSTTQVQYNNAGVLAGITGATTNGTAMTLVAPVLGTPASGTVTNLTGTASININGTVGATTPAAGAFASITDSGNLTFTGTGNRITGDFTNATFANRVAFQTSSANTATTVLALPSGSGTTASWDAYNNSDPTNSSYLGLSGLSTETRLSSAIRGTGTFLPMTFYAGGSERARIDTSGNLLVGTTTSPAGSNELVLGGDYIEGVVVKGTVGSTNTISLASGTVQTATLTASTPCTFTMPTAIAGKSFILILTQAATGMTTAVFTSVKYPGGTAPTITATASAKDILTFVADGTNWYGTYAQAFA